MKAGPLRAVFDCNILLQALVSNQGPAHACLEEAAIGRCVLSVSAYVIEELREVAERPEIRARFRLDSQMVEEFVADLKTFAVEVREIPEVFVHPTDPKDSHYINLAIATGSMLIVSRDRHLLDLTDPTKALSGEFLRQFPLVRVFTPPEFLHVLRDWHRTIEDAGANP